MQDEGAARPARNTQREACGIVLNGEIGDGNLAGARAHLDAWVVDSATLLTEGDSGGA